MFFLSAKKTVPSELGELVEEDVLSLAEDPCVIREDAAFAEFLFREVMRLMDEDAVKWLWVLTNMVNLL